MKAPHLVADITAHGYGHLVQSAMVLNALRELRPDLRLTIRCDHPTEVLRGFIKPPFDLAPSPPDIGMAMLGPSRIDAPASLSAYQAIFSEWNDLVAVQSASLRGLKPDMHYTNIGFVGVAAAVDCGVRSIGLCSLNWLDIFSGYCLELAGGNDIAARLAEVYSGLELFIQPTPSMPMTPFTRFVEVGPIARSCKRPDAEKIDAIRNRFSGSHIVSASMGGIPADAGWDILPKIDDVSWITPKDAPSGRTDIDDCESLGLDYIDAFCASDLTVAKTGYGTFAEAVCNGVRLLYAARADWPEAPALEKWADEHGCTMQCTQQALYKGEISKLVTDLLARPRAPELPPSGAQDAAQILAAQF